MKITPNQITIARIVVLPPAIWTLFQTGVIWQLVSWAIFFVIAMSDVVDGKLARSSGQITEMGKFLDPDRKSTRLNSSHMSESRMPSSA